MSYIDLTYYKDEFHGESVADADFPKLLIQAEEAVEELTLYRLNATTFSSMDVDTQKRVKDAVCAQIEYLDANGGNDIDNGNDYASVSLGKFNYSKGSSEQSIYSPRAKRILAATDLLFRGENYEVYT